MTASEPGTPQADRTPPRSTGGGVLALGLGTLLVLGALSALVTAAALETQTGAANYVIAESLWSKGRSEAVQALYAYATTGEEPELRRARDALAIPLAFRATRRALERTPSDPAAARAGLLRAGVPEADVGRMIRFYESFARVGLVNRAIEVWRQADESILRLQDIADELEVVHGDAEGPVDGEERIMALRRELAVVNASLRPLELAFSRTLADGVRRLRTTLLFLTALTFLAMSGIAAAVIGSAYGRVRLSTRNLRASYQQAAVGMARLDRSGRFVDANDAFCRLLGRSRGALIETTLTDVMYEEDLPRNGRLLALAETTGGALERRFVRADGSVMWGRMTVSQVELGHRAGTHLFVIVEDISEAHRLAEELDYRARHDALTGLINRFEIERRLEATVASGARHGESHALCFVDLDQFKIVNDTCGHAAGDHLLRQVASLLTRSLRTNDTVGRLGGDEFAVILDHAGFEEAHAIANELRRALADHVFRWDDRTFDVTCSIGFVEIVGGDEPASSWLRKADIACYLAKETGRNRVHAYVEGDEALVERQDQIAWVGRIREAIGEGRLSLYAQRIVPVRGPASLGYELLLRVLDRDGEERLPDAFMPAAERYGLATDLDRWVVGETLATLSRHPEHVARLHRCHVNLSAQSISDDEFRTFLMRALDAHDDVPGRKLCFEITETAVIRDLPDAQALIAGLRARGCLVALDDFGSGLSSFGHLRSLAVDLVKIDGVFIRDMADSDLDRTIVRSVHDVAKVLGRETVAEFVESDEVREVLEGIGIDYAQGVAIHAPERWEALLGEGAREG